MGLERNLESRLSLLKGLRSEVVGPDPRGKALDCLPKSLTREQAWNELIAVQQQTGEEILTRETPVRRYGAGVIFPRYSEESAAVVESGDLGLRDVQDDESNANAGSEAQAQARNKGFDVDADDTGITATNAFKPSAVGLSFVIDLEKLGPEKLRIVVASRFRIGSQSWQQTDCGFYREHKLKLTDTNIEEPEQRDVSWWYRAPFVAGGKAPEVLLDAHELDSGSERRQLQGVDGYIGRIALRWHVRRWPGGEDRERLVTLTLVNESKAGEYVLDAACLFQSGLVVEAPPEAIGDYPRALLPMSDDDDPLDDDLVNRVIYSKRTVKAVGHGCSADWCCGDDGVSLWTDVMPAWEMAPMAFDITDAHSRSARLPMRTFTEMSQDDSAAFGLLENLVSSYENWINELKPDRFPKELRMTADALVARCRRAAGRMRDGLVHLGGHDKNVLRAFSLANRAMLMAQHRRSGEARSPQFDAQLRAQVWKGRDGRSARQPVAAPTLRGWNDPYIPLDLEARSTKEAEERGDRPVGHWRPFQLAFLLMSIEGILRDDCDDRETVDLIWFPTGGGKTEAYLGLTAFTVFYNVLSGRVGKQANNARAVSILMRYTLRLLTAQQFERAVKLFCAMELIREKDTDGLGSAPFTVGLWVGRSNTPNGVDDAAAKLNKLREDQSAANPFVLLQCPWCAAKFGHVAHGVVHGYRITGKGGDATLEYVCPDRRCEFGQGNIQIPAQVVDENLYRAPPTLLIGTVDKFAMLAWTPVARSFFGIGANGSRVAAAPTLIIQDEMHLMTGPLGTMVGLFETAVDALCRYGDGSSPKIIASTATAARAGDQIRGLYARGDSMVFPPPGLDASDSFFAREDKSSPGRLYVGILAPGHGSMQTTQRNVYSALAQGAADLALEAHANCEGSAQARNKAAAEAADPWWTLLAYYNSLRELGGALTLFGADIPDQLGVLRKRRAAPHNESRRVYVDGRVLELTSRLDSGEVPQALRSLESVLGEFAEDNGVFSVQAKYGPQDACLASNIIEVGVDVPRLSLMAIVGQPKTTAAYIQASSRVGRREDRPGLVVMLYSSTKPRDRSHYERFRAYHQAIYAWVEPTSVTPFSPPVVDRALHAVMVSMLRQTVANAAPRQVIADDEAISWMEEALEARAGEVARDDEKAGVRSKLRRLRREWGAYNPENWGKIVLQGDLGANASLMYPAGRTKPAQWGKAGWATPTSLRAVDATCEADITGHYADDRATNDDDVQGEH